MGERSRVHLPSLGALVRTAGPPTVAEARAALGGTASGTRSGARVEIDRGRGRTAEGLVVHETETETDVWIGDGVFARLKRPEVPRLLTRPSVALDGPAADLVRFSAMAVGQTVLAQRGTGRLSGRILELCRYGALLDVGGKVVAVGFRALHA